MLISKSHSSLLLWAFVFAFVGGLHTGALCASETVWLDTINPAQWHQDYEKPGVNKSIDGNPLTLSGRRFEHGIGTHANSSLALDLDGRAEKFSAVVGVDGEIKANNPVSLEFVVIGDGNILWTSGVMKSGDPGKKIDLDLKGVKSLGLLVNARGETIHSNHADWADARFEVADGAILKPLPELPPPHEEAVILTPKEGPAPRINGAKVFGVRPGHPFLFTVAATGVRPMKFSADPLPVGLSLDSDTGRITGLLREKGEYTVTLHAKNAVGEASRKLRIVVGDTLALTPPMGWNSWNCFCGAVTDANVRAAADVMVKSGLINHGWTYINIDDTWEGERGKEGFIDGNKKFPDMKSLGDYVHGLGLKFGIYSSPGPKTCAGFPGSYQYEDKDVQRYAQWGVDYVKYDYCTFSDAVRQRSADAILSALPKDSADAAEIRRLCAQAAGKRFKEDWDALWDIDHRIQEICAKLEVEQRKPIEWMISAEPFNVFGKSLGRVDRDMVYSLSTVSGKVWEWGGKVGANCWRTSGDISDKWSSMSANGFGEAGLEKFAGPGHWNDPDMLEVGQVGWGPPLHPSKLTPNEQYTHLSLWSLLAAPLLIGCDMTQMDDFTLNLLTNDEVIDINQDPLGKQAERISKNGDLEVWARELEDGSRAVGLFNRGQAPQTVSVPWKSLGVKDRQMVRDVWRRKDLGVFEKGYEVTVPRHGVQLIRVGAGREH
jgi:alpha-galactosidase